MMMMRELDEPWVALWQGLDELVEAGGRGALLGNDNLVVVDVEGHELVLPLGLEILELEHASVVNRSSCRTRLLAFHFTRHTDTKRTRGKE